MTYPEMLQTMEFMFSQRAEALPPKALAEIFDRMIWCLVDGGAALLQVREVWLTSNEKEKVEIALAMDETYPFDEAARMEAVCGEISLRWPELAGRCEDLVNARRAEVPRR